MVYKNDIIDIPRKDLEQHPKTYHRNLLIFALYNDGWNKTQIGKVVGLSSSQVGSIILGKTTKEVNILRYLKYAEDNKKRVRQWAQDNPDRKLEQDRKYYLENKDRIKNKVNIWQQDNLDKVRHYHRKYREKDTTKQLHKEYERIRRSLKANAFFGYVPDNLVDYLFVRQNSICPLCNTELLGPLEIDHKIPISSGRSIECICNLQLTHESCNRSKLSKILLPYEKLNQLSLELSRIRRKVI